MFARVAPDELLGAVERALVGHFGSPGRRQGGLDGSSRGVSPGRASVVFVGVEPIEVLRFPVGAGEVVYATLGMSRQPMTAGSADAVEPDAPRAELVLRLHGDGAQGGGGHDDERDRTREVRYGDVWRQLAVLAAAPSVEGVVYREGMTVDLGRPLATGASCTGVVVTSDGLDPVRIGDGIAVALLRVIPATAEELAWCRVHGAASLLQRWSAADTDVLDLGRRAVALG